jgi:hypothetical protein
MIDERGRDIMGLHSSSRSNTVMSLKWYLGVVFAPLLGIGVADPHAIFRSPPPNSLLPALYGAIFC